MIRHASPTLPVTIIGGYLGAGKTTLVNHLLRNADGLRLAVLVNEFGELPIDADLIEAQDDKIISIAGGCVCCSYGNDLMLAMMELAKMNPRPDHVLLEASGVAIPGAIAASVGLLAEFSIDGVVIVADAETVRNNAADRFVGDTISRQLRDADIIALNKTDLVAAERVSELLQWLHHVAPQARTVPAMNSNVPPATVLESFLGRTRHAGIRHKDKMFQTVSLEIEMPVDVEALARKLAGEELGLVRAKGFANSRDGRNHAIQIVGRRWSVSDAGNDIKTGIVCIGMKPRFDPDALMQAIADVAV